jgi:hypothetical protein
MSEFNHPNLHAAGLLCDIIEAIEKRLRGSAKEVSFGNILHSINEGDLLVEFVAGVEEVIDRECRPAKAFQKTGRNNCKTPDCYLENGHVGPHSDS